MVTVGDDSHPQESRKPLLALAVQGREGPVIDDALAICDTLPDDELGKLEPQLRALSMRASRAPTLEAVAALRKRLEQ